MYSPREYEYVIGKTGVLINTPCFAESEKFRIFKGTGSTDDKVCVAVTVNEEITVPPGVSLAENGETVICTDDGFITFECEKGRLLWKSVHTPLFVRAEVTPQTAGSLNTAEMLAITELPYHFTFCGALVLHAAVCVYDNEAILFTGEKGAGKSTAAELWQQFEGAEILNGDRALIYEKDGKVYVSGNPYCGTSGICKSGVYPVKAVVKLSHGTENEIKTLSGSEFLIHLLSACSLRQSSRVQMNAFFDAAEKIIGKIPFFGFSCLPDESAVTVLREFLRR